MELADAVTAAAVAVDEVARISVDHCDASELRNELSRMKQLQSKLDAQLARLTHAADAAGAFIGTGAKDTAEWLGRHTGTSTRKNRGAAELGEAMARSDDLANAVTTGRLSTDQAATAVGAAGGEAIDAEVIDGDRRSRCPRSGPPSRRGGPASTLIATPTSRRLSGRAAL